MRGLRSLRGRLSTALHQADLSMERTYRSLMRPELLVGYRVQVQESDLMVYTTTEMRQSAWDWLEFYRRQISTYLQRDTRFQTSLAPLPLLPGAPEIIRSMGRAAGLAGVGPMAAVAGAIAEFVGRKLASQSAEVIVENGGDIWVHSQRERHVLVHAGLSPWSERVAIRLRSDQPLSICTSSGTVGHSLSFGAADAALAISRDASLADAVATAIGNRVKTPADIEAAVDFAAGIPGISGCLVIIGDHLGVRGQIELITPGGGIAVAAGTGLPGQPG